MSAFDSERLANSLSEVVSRQIGIKVEGSVSELAGGLFPTIRFTDLPKPGGVSLIVSNLVSKIAVETVFDNFSKPLIQEMGDYLAEDLSIWLSLVESATRNGVHIYAEVNNISLSDMNDLPRGPWENFHLEVKTTIKGRDGRKDAVEEAATVAASLLMALLSVEEIEPPDDLSDIVTHGLGEVEGRRMRVEINRYERSRKNRSACIAIYGEKCQVCFLDFGKMYGNLGRGYIEVHHRLPVSLMEQEYALSPKTDLIPVCSNCHRMMHRTWPPVEPETLKQIVEKEKNAQEQLPNVANF